MGPPPGASTSGKACATKSGGWRNRGGDVERPCLTASWTAAEKGQSHGEIRLVESITCHTSVAGSYRHYLRLPAHYAWRPCEYHVWYTGDEDQTGRSCQNRSRPGVKRPTDGAVHHMAEGHRHRETRQIFLEGGYRGGPYRPAWTPDGRDCGDGDPPLLGRGHTCGDPLRPPAELGAGLPRQVLHRVISGDTRLLAGSHDRAGAAPVVGLCAALRCHQPLGQPHQECAARVRACCSTGTRLIFPFDAFIQC